MAAARSSAICQRRRVRRAAAPLPPPRRLRSLRHARLSNDAFCRRRPLRDDAVNICAFYVIIPARDVLRRVALAAATRFAALERLFRAARGCAPMVSRAAPHCFTSAAARTVLWSVASCFDARAAADIRPLELLECAAVKDAVVAEARRGYASVMPPCRLIASRAGASGAQRVVLSVYASHAVTRAKAYKMRR